MKDINETEDNYKLIKQLGDGIWFIGSVRNGYSARILTKYISDLPEVPELAELERFKMEILSDLSNFLFRCRINDHFPTADEIVKEIFSSMRGGTDCGMRDRV